MTNQLHYKDYVGSVIFSEEDGVFHGKVLGIPESISFEGDSVNSLTADFHHAVDEYLEYCVEADKQPSVSSFIVKLSPEIFNKAMVTAGKKGLSVDVYVEEILKNTALA